MKLLLVSTLLAVTCSSCFTANLLNDKNKPSYIPNDSYSLTRTYYGGDSLLHFDFLNDNSKRPKTRYYTIALNVNAILQQYYREGGGDVDFSRKLARRNRAISAWAVMKNCTCVEAFRYGNAVLIDVKNTRVRYLRNLPPVNYAALIKNAGLLATDCCWAPRTDDEDNNEEHGNDNTPPVNNITPIYVVPIAPKNPGDSAQDFVAVRMRLKNRRTKIAWVPLTLMLDIVTSPVQLGILWLNSNADKPPNGDIKAGRSNKKHAGQKEPVKKKEEKHRHK